MPWTCAISTPISRAKRRVDGAAGTGPSVEIGAGGGFFDNRSGSYRCRRTIRRIGGFFDDRSDRWFLWGWGRGRFRCRGCFLDGWGFTRLDFEDGLPDSDGVALLDENSGDSAIYGRRHLNDGLVGFKLDDSLIFGEVVADIDEDADYIAAFNVFSQVGQGKFYRHNAV